MQLRAWMLGHQPHGMCAVGPICNFAQLIMAKAMRCLEGEFKEPEIGFICFSSKFAFELYWFCSAFLLFDMEICKQFF